MSNHQLQPYISFLNETADFQRAVVYLLNIYIAAEEFPETAVAEAHRKFSSQIAPTFKHPHYYFLSRLFVAHVAAFEIFLQETLSMVIREHPKKVGEAEFSLNEILESSSTEELVDRASNALISKIMYRRPLEYLQGICKTLSIDQSKVAPDWGIFIDAKARRDLGVHNAWKVNSVYIRKVGEAGVPSELKLGEIALPQDQDYLDAFDEALSRLAESITDQVLRKFWPQLTINVAGDA